MNKILFIGIIVIISFLYSCNNIPDPTPSTIANDTIDISKALNKFESVNLSTITTKIEYIQLQTDSNCFFGRIYDKHKSIKFSKNRIFISDGHKLLSFNHHGEFMAQYGRKGKGPSEFTEIERFAIIEDKEQIAILSNGVQKLLFFDFQGNHTRNLKIDFWPTDLTYFNNKLIFITPKGRRHRSNYYTLSVMTLEGDLQKQLIFNENEKEVEKKEKLKFGAFNHHYVLNDTLYYWEYLYDIIWKISGNFRAIPSDLIFYSNDKFPFESFLESSPIELNLITSRQYVKNREHLNTNRYMFFYINNKSRLNKIYYDKKNKESYSLQFRDKITNRLKFSFTNDIDGGLPFWPHGVISENKVFRLIYGYELKQYLNLKKKKNEIQLHYPVLEKIANNAKIDDNPILMIVTLKE